MAWGIQISVEAKTDIQEAISWYNNKQPGLGKRFYKEITNSFKLLKRSPYFGIRYQRVRCLKVHKFPYLIHYVLDEPSQTIIIPGVLNTSLNPDEYWFKDLE